MAKYFSFIAENVTPLSQNNRSIDLLNKLTKKLKRAYNKKYGAGKMPLKPKLANYLSGKVFYIHRVPDYKDADNISKPLWDSLNKQAYNDDNQIKYIETLKVSITEFNNNCEFDFTKLDEEDFSILLDFVDNYGGKKERILYVNISEYETENISFI